ncbi:MAG: DUF2069 domain-containing protein [Burkholderiales bacterium]|jgi:uncharacterized membrane protein
MSRSPEGGSDPRWRRATTAALVALALLEILWELWLAPLKPGGSWLALKALPLLALTPGVAQGRLRARQWALLLLPWYLAEGVVRAFSETGRQALCAGAAVALALAALAAGLGWFRAQGRLRRAPG